MLRWEVLCKGKDKGGLRFCDIEVFNFSLLGKQCWRIIQKPDSMVAKVLKAKYFVGRTFMESQLRGRHSYVWCSI